MVWTAFAVGMFIVVFLGVIGTACMALAVDEHDERL